MLISYWSSDVCSSDLPAQVARPRFMVDDTGRNEQRRLEGRMIDRVKDRRDRRQRPAEAEQQSDEAEMADCRIGEQTGRAAGRERVSPSVKNSGLGVSFNKKNKVESVINNKIIQ